jgi:hypothetical protein
MTRALRLPTGRRRRILGFVVLVILVFVTGFGFGWVRGKAGAFPYPQLAAVRRILRGGPARDARLADVPPGRYRPWRPIDRPSAPTLARGSEAGGPAAFGYPSSSRPAPSVWGVTVHDRDSALPGVNLLVSGHGPEALLIDMEGRVLHGWSRDCSDVWPDAPAAHESEGAHFWQSAYAFPDGDLLAIYDGVGLVRLNADSDLVWSYSGAVHDDLFVTDDGLVYTLERETAALPGSDEDESVLADVISVLGPDGKPVRRIPLLEAFERSPYAPLLQRAPRRGDVLGAGTIEVLGNGPAGVSPAFRAGNVLVSLRRIDVIAVVDIETEAVVWALTGRGDGTSRSTVLDSGRMLLLNGEASGRRDGTGRSEVIEIDQFSQETVWSYSGSDDCPLYSATLGSCQRLANGNTLITESDNGRALEIAPDGTVVWEFVSPYRAGPDGELIATLFEAVRLPPSFGAGWIQEEK